ncbi:hypothetical protein NESM_000162900 [Novymonas esmeraldas]|uniref:Uncharacterized protein n=1 Tax=Novymonas esmeraldas TaxID=1808958 RepID=A0AAW0F5D6_9TRYP
MTARCDVVGAKNLQAAVVPPVLLLYCDLSRDCGASSSGKSVLISSSSGNKPLGNSGAFLGLNIFTKSLEKRNLSGEATAALRTEAFTDVGDGCQWRIEEDAVTLCIRIDFAAAKGRPGASGKSVLLATTGGNKPIGDTGLSCGLNCYYPADKTFDASRLAAGDSVEDQLRIGQSRDMGEGFLVSHPTATEMRVSFRYCAADMADGRTASLPSCTVGDMKVAMHISAPKAARARTERSAPATDAGASSVTPTSTPSQSQSSRATASGDLVVEAGKEEGKVRNVVVVCTAASAPEATAASAAVSHLDGEYLVDLRFDPTQSFGRSSSGKSLTVASTAGFQRVADADGRVVCRLSFNAYRPAPPLSEAEILAAVQAVLSVKPAASLPTLSFKEVLEDVLGALGAVEAMRDVLKPKIKDAVVAYVQAANTTAA